MAITVTCGVWGCRLLQILGGPQHQKVGVYQGWRRRQGAPTFGTTADHHQSTATTIGRYRPPISRPILPYAKPHSQPQSVTLQPIGHHLPLLVILRTASVVLQPSATAQPRCLSIASNSGETPAASRAHVHCITTTTNKTVPGGSAGKRSAPPCPRQFPCMRPSHWRSRPGPPVYQSPLAETPEAV